MGNNFHVRRILSVLRLLAEDKLYTKRDGIEIDKLRYRIKVAAIPDSVPGTIRIFNETTLEFSRVPLCNENLADIKQIVKDFIFKLAVLIWHFKEKTANISSDVMSSIRQSNLSTVRQFLDGLEYSPESIEKCIEILEYDFDKRLTTLAEAPDGKFLALISDAGRYAVALENETIAKIRGAYRKYTGLTSDPQIISSMSIVLASVDFWPSEEVTDERKQIMRYIERLKKRIKQIAGKNKKGIYLSGTSLHPPYCIAESPSGIKEVFKECHL